MSPLGGRPFIEQRFPAWKRCCVLTLRMAVNFMKSLQGAKAVVQLYAAAFLVLAFPACLAGAEKTLGEKVIAFCQLSRGRMVGNGQCSSLAQHALLAAGARGRAEDSPGPDDYTWGRQVFLLSHAQAGPATEGKIEDVKPGCIIQFRDTRWSGKTPRGRYWMEMEHHTAVVAAVEEKGAFLRILHQNYGTHKLVTEARLRLSDLRNGWLRVYEPVPAQPRP